METHRYYTCGFCSSGIAFPVFHWSTDWLYEWHKPYMKEKKLQILETGSLEVTIFPYLGDGKFGTEQEKINESNNN